MTNIKKIISDMWQKKWLKRSIITISIFVIILTIAPVIIQYSITKILVDQGAKKADINDINLNLFEGTFELKDLVITTYTDEQILFSYLYADINMMELFSSKVVAEQIEVRGVDTHIHRNENGAILINGLKLPSSENVGKENESDSPPSEPINFGVNLLLLNDIKVVYSEPDFSQKKHIQSIELRNLKSWNKDSNAQLNLTMMVNQAPIEINTELKLFHTKKQLKGNISITSLDFSKYEKFHRPYLGQLKGLLTAQSSFEVNFERVNEQLVISANTGTTLEVSDLALNFQQIDHSTKYILWKGKSSYQSDGSLAISGNIDIAESHTGDTLLDYEMASFGKLKLINLKTDLKDLSFNSLTLENIKVVSNSKTEKFIQLGQIEIDQLQLKPKENELNIQSVKLSQPDVWLNLDNDKQITQLAPLLQTIDRLIPPTQKTTNSSLNNPPEGQSKGSNTMDLSVGSFELQKPGTFYFVDTSISPHYKSNFEIQKINIQPISVTKPAQFNAVIQQGKYTLFDISGTGQLFDFKNQLNLKAKVKQLDLPPVTSYTSKAMGYGMKSGVVDSDINLSLIKGDIDSLVKLKIDSIEVVETNSKTAEQVSSASGMSIDLALSTLKDKHNVIELELPIQGNIDEPEFDISLIINKAMGKAMQSASLTYLKHALQPFGSILTLYKLAETAANHISLAPVLFETNSLEFKPEQQELLNKVTSILKNRPEIKIKTCSISTLQDEKIIHYNLLETETTRLEEKYSKENSQQSKVKLAEEIKNLNIPKERILQQMIELADQRAAKVKAYFIGKADIQPARILNCLSVVKTEEDLQPNVELQI